MSRKIIVVTGTRADYGKMKSVMKKIEQCDEFELYVFVTGMHTLTEFGFTLEEVKKDRYQNIHMYMNQYIEENMDSILSNTISGLSRYVHEIDPDMIIVHGDRVEALAGAIVGAINNILVSHIEGGEVSGTIDESIRHAISKFAHLHFVSNNIAKKRLIQLGEDVNRIFVIGSPNIDLIMNSDLDIEFVKKYYDIKFRDYAICMFHPVTSEVDTLKYQVDNLVQALIKSGFNYILVKPNNDTGFKIINNAYTIIHSNCRFKLFSSLRFEYYIELLKNAKFIIGNSSSGIYEAPVVGIPTINVGSRQNGRFQHSTIIDCSSNESAILKSIKRADEMTKLEASNNYGNGDSTERFISILKSKRIFLTPIQKKFNSIGI